jgi:hypothetical protein
MSFRGACCLIVCFAAVSSAGAPVLGQSFDPVSNGPDQPNFEAQEIQPIRRKTDSEPYTPLALRAGVFDFHPALGVEAIYSDNPGQLSSDSRPAAGIRLAPELEFKSDWVRHEIKFKI